MRGRDMLETGQETPSTPAGDEPAAAPAAPPGGPDRPGGLGRVIGQVMTALGLLVVVALGVLAVREGGAISEILLAQPTATSAGGVATATPSPTAVPTAPVATLPPAVIATGVLWTGNGSAIAQACQGSQPLAASTFEVDNSHS